MTVLAQATLSQEVAPACPAEQPQPLVPEDQALCRALDPLVRDPSALPLAEYQQALDRYFRGFCHRDEAAGWARDKYVRDTGPATARLADGRWLGSYNGTHMPVMIWYSPEMADWMRTNRTAAQEDRPRDDTPVPDGAIMVKEMYPAPAARCADADPLRLLPVPHGAAIMIRDGDASHDGWFWGWYGYQDWAPDHPANADTNPLPNMGFGAYCMNCHASARDNLTFAAARNLADEPGEPLVFLSQDDDPTPSPAANHPRVVLPDGDGNRLGQPHLRYDLSFLAAYASPGPGARPDWNTVPRMPSETYDDVTMPAGHPKPGGALLPSAQCLGCHGAGGTGLHFDMTEPDPVTGKLWNLSPYATWRSSPMGLAGRDPIFFAQLASETQSFHAGSSELVQNTCFGCHGFLGQRQFGIDQAAGPARDGRPDCGTFTRGMVDAVPFPSGHEAGRHQDYGALARDGVSCMACHRMVLGEDASRAVADAPQNACIAERQDFLNPDNTGFARTFTGSFPISGPDVLYGPFREPRQAPMETALGIRPEHNATIQSSEVCGTCHTVHLPVMRDGAVIGRVYEQLTYPEWAFSAYRTGTTPDGPLPGGAGERAQSCQDCHMPSTDPDGAPTRSKIASIQEHANYPEAEFAMPPEEIDLPVREGFSRHDLVGSNLFLIKMAQQFPDILGIRTRDPMLTTKGVDPLIRTERAMLEQAVWRTARVSVERLHLDDEELAATVRVENLAGHKFPSGVGFRRAFLSFEVLDPLGAVLWASGRTDGAGRLLDAEGGVLPGERWWDDDCSARIEPGRRLHQPHHQTISRQDQVQVYQELVSAPPENGPARCGHAAAPSGPLTTSFLSICAEVKDNRLLPHGFLPLPARTEIARALGAGPELAEDAGSTAVGNDPDYRPGRAGGDRLVYRVGLDGLDGRAAAVRARLFYQATPPFYLQDRFCTAEGADRDRLYFLAGHLNLDDTAAENWKLLISDSGAVMIPRP